MVVSRLLCLLSAVTAREQAVKKTLPIQLLFGRAGARLGSKRLLQLQAVLVLSGNLIISGFASEGGPPRVMRTCTIVRLPWLNDFLKVSLESILSLPLRQGPA